MENGTYAFLVYLSVCYFINACILFYLFIQDGFIDAHDLAIWFLSPITIPLLLYIIVKDLLLGNKNETL